MEFAEYLTETRKQAAALRAAAVTAGPEAEVPTCPGWTVHRLVRHIARVQAQVVLSLDADPAGEAPRTERPPEDWDELLAFWDQTVGTMLDGLAYRGPGRPAWAFAGFSGTSFWARRQAHETAIHRLDAEHAAHGADVPHLVFDPCSRQTGSTRRSRSWSRASRSTSRARSSCTPPTRAGRGR